MSITTRTPPRARTDARVIRMPLSTRTRKLLLLVHIAAAGVWLGLDLALGILVVTALTADATGAGAAAASLASIATWPLVIVGLVTLASGVLLGLGTKYGLVRYRWVLVKLVVNVVLVTLVVLVLWPGLTSLGDAGRAALADGAAPDGDGDARLPAGRLVDRARRRDDAVGVQAVGAHARTEVPKYRRNRERIGSTAGSTDSVTDSPEQHVHRRARRGRSAVRLSAAARRAGSTRPRARRAAAGRTAARDARDRS